MTNEVDRLTPDNLDKIAIDRAHEAIGTVVVIDVVRAFTTAAYALAAGAKEIVLVDSVEKAFRLREESPNSLLMGEVKGDPIAGFDYGNSPYELSQADVAWKVDILRAWRRALVDVRADRRSDGVARYAGAAEYVLACQGGQIFGREVAERPALHADGRAGSVDNHDSWSSISSHALDPLHLRLLKLNNILSW